MNAPATQSALSADDASLLAAAEGLATGLDARQLSLLVGFFVGRLPASTATVTAPASQSRWLIAYGSQTGNGKAIAQALAAQASGQSASVDLKSMAALRARDLARYEHLSVVVSTHGDGEVPDAAAPLLAQLVGKRAPDLSGLAFSVFALGDSSYPLFCSAGDQVAAALRAAGATLVDEVIKADLDYAELAEQWQTDELARGGALSTVATSTVVDFPTQVAAVRETRAEVYVNQTIVGRGSPKNVRHLELGCDTPLSYAPGDSIAVVPRNGDNIIAPLLQAWNLAADDAIVESLRGKELTQVRRSTLERLAPFADDGLADILALDAAALRDKLNDHQLIDLVATSGWHGATADILAALPAVEERLYSIASAPSATPDEIHLTLAVEQFVRDGQHRYGAASNWLAKLSDGDAVSLALRENDGFRLPQDDVPLILMGPGTGVAPFRAFTDELEARGRQLPTWLFFGNPYMRTDFLYQLEWQRKLRDGVLDRISLAFSRDGATKHYVQHQLQAEMADALAWLSDGAHVYICGGLAMGAAVTNVLQHQMGDEAFQDFIADGRLHRDLY